MKRIACVVLLFFAFGLHSQSFELKKVTKAELQETQHKSDTSAVAAFLFKKAKTTFNYSENEGFVCTTIFEIKLKIYKKEGLDWANFSIPYYMGYKTINDESVIIENAYTYNLEEDKIVKTKVTGDGKFNEQLNEYWGVKSVTFPNVKVGSIIELEYKFKSENLSILPEFQYQYSIPVNYAAYKSEIPEFYIYQAMKNGYIDLEIKQKLEYTSQAFQSKADKASISKSMSYSQINSSYVASNIPALIEEDYVNNIKNYYGKLNHELQMIRMPNEAPKQITSSWDDVAKSIYNEKEFGLEIEKIDYFKEHLKAQLVGVTDITERTKKIFNYVKNNMNWDGKFGYFPKKGLEKAYNEKVGNVAEINLLLVAMLKLAGVEANPVLISTRENGSALFPNRSLLNYVIAAVTIQDKIMLLDATDKFADIDMLPVRDLNGKGRLIKKNGTSTEIDLMPQSNSNEVKNGLITINTLGEASGKIRGQYFNYNAIVFRDKYNGVAKESYIEKLEKTYQGLEVAEYDVQNSNELAKPIIENYSFTNSNVVEIIGSKMYFSPFLFFATAENPFKQEKREYPIDFVFPNQKKYNMTIIIPEGYKVESLPLNSAVALQDGLGSFKYSISNTGNQVQLLFTFDINQAIIEAEYYEGLKIFFKAMVAKQTEKIVLTKA